MAFNFLKRKPKQPTPQPEVEEARDLPVGFFDAYIPSPPARFPEFAHPGTPPSAAYDSAGFKGGVLRGAGYGGVNLQQLGFFAANSKFIGYYACSVHATNWLIDKACLAPARAAVRNGYSLGKELDPIRYKTDKEFQVNANMVELIHFGRIYGGRAILFKVKSENEEKWYKNPFNIDGVTPGSYEGMSQIDPNWMQPVLTDVNMTDPTSPNFYKPTYWKVGEQLIHHSHMHFYIPNPVPDYLKPEYRYLGIPTIQRIAERVYAAERSANEAPQLLMTKRTTVMQVGPEGLLNRGELEKNMQEWAAFRDNYGIKVHGDGESVSQFDTSMGEVDSTIMTQYQLVSAASDIPVTVLMGTTPKGFQSTGEHESRNYYQMLEGIQLNDLSPLLERHYTLLQASKGMVIQDVEPQWMSCDSPTSIEIAELEDKEASRDEKLHRIGAITPLDVRRRVSADKDSGYYGVKVEAEDEQ